MSLTNSPLRYPGGKSTISSFLAQTIFLNDLEGGVYIEPYAGGAGAALNLLFKGVVRKIIINDYDPVIYAFWISILSKPEEFIKRVSTIPLNINEWNRQKEIIKTYQKQEMLDVGFAAFYLNRCNRSGILKAGPIGGKRQSGKYTLDVRFNRENLIKKICRIVKFKEKIKVYNYDAISFLRDEVQNIEGPKLIYLDPPYYEKGQQLYLNAYEHEDHENLAWALTKMSPFDYWILTYDDAPQIRELYNGSSKSMYSLNYYASHPKKGRELLITPPIVRLPDQVDTRFVLA